MNVIKRLNDWFLTRVVAFIDYGDRDIPRAKIEQLFADVKKHTDKIFNPILLWLTKIVG